MGKKINLKVMSRCLPNCIDDITRLNYLLGAKYPQIAVFGKYNHGKSTILNACVGEDIFNTGDNRVTTEIKKIEHNQIVWCDTPGLDADIYENDDRLANQARNESDYIFIIHNVRAGELDKKEYDFLKNQLSRDPNNTDKIVIVLSQIDQLEIDNLVVVTKAINAQLDKLQILADSKLKIISISAMRYLKGESENKPNLSKKSNMSELFSIIEDMKLNIEDIRKREITNITKELLIELTKNESDLRIEMSKIENKEAMFLDNAAELKDEIEWAEIEWNEKEGSLKNRDLGFTLVNTY